VEYAVTLREIAERDQRDEYGQACAAPTSALLLVGSRASNACPRFIRDDEAASNACEVTLLQNATQDPRDRGDAWMRRAHQENARM